MNEKREKLGTNIYQKETLETESKQKNNNLLKLIIISKKKEETRT